MITWNNVEINRWEEYDNYFVFMVPKEFYTVKCDYGKNAELVSYLVSRVEIATERLRDKNDFDYLFVLYTPILNEIIEVCKKEITYSELIFSLEQAGRYSRENVIDAVKILYKLRLIGFAKDIEEVGVFCTNMRKNSKATPLSMEILYSYIYKKMGIPYMFAPSKFTFVVTNKCNARCTTCYRGHINIDKSLKYTRELTTEEIFEIINYLHQIGTDRIKLLGGEPFCREDIFEILNYAHNFNMITEISTNGLALAEKENIEKVKKLNACLLNIQISIDGMEKGQNLQRVGADFDKVVRAMDNLKEENLLFSTNTIVSRVNKDEIDDLICFLAKYNVSSRFQIMKACGTGAENLENILTPFEKREVIKLIDNAAIKYHANVRNSVVFHPFVNNEKTIDLGPATYHRCRSCTYGMAITPEGYALPCEFLEPFSAFRCENVKEKSIMDIWHENSTFKKLRYVQVQGKCAKCEYSAVCEMGCFAETMGLTGDIMSSDPVCWYEPRSGMVTFPETNEYIEENCKGE
ncbi:MAG: radical SAM/SPASM domain-containing protein [Acetatifactor sp.]